MGLFSKGPKVKPYQSANVGNYEGQLSDEVKKRIQGNKEVQPYKFNFGQLPEEATRIGYAEGAKSINRESADALTKAQQTIGTRRPGLLYKAAESTNRDTNSNLASLNNTLQANKINKNLELNQSQQEAEAGNQLQTKQTNFATDPIQYLQQLYAAALAGTNQGAGVAQQGKSSTLGFLSNLI